MVTGGAFSEVVPSRVCDIGIKCVELLNQSSDWFGIVLGVSATHPKDGE